jgi:DNA-directed RNA polymerase subunit E'/Rpb7
MNIALSGSVKSRQIFERQYVEADLLLVNDFAKAVVSGEVFHRSPFGVWLDVRLGFPALLEIIFMDGLTPQRYKSDDYCPLGTKVSATVMGFNEPSRQICLMQCMPASLRHGI